MNARSCFLMVLLAGVMAICGLARAQFEDLKVELLADIESNATGERYDPYFMLYEPFNDMQIFSSDELYWKWSPGDAQPVAFFRIPPHNRYRVYHPLDEKFLFGWGQDRDSSFEYAWLDGTVGGTEPIEQLNGFGLILARCDIDGYLLFATENEGYGYTLYSMDLATDNVSVIAENFRNSISDESLFVIGGRAVFGVRKSSGFRLFASDGTVAGTNEITEGSIEFSSISKADDKLFATRQTADAGRMEFWVTDGTLAGTRKFFEHQIGTTHFFDDALAAGDYLFMSFLPIPFREFDTYISDGTAEGTHLVRAPLFGHSNRPYFRSHQGIPLLKFEDHLYVWNRTTLAFDDLGEYPFTIKSRHLDLPSAAVFLDSSADVLWRTDGTVDGTYVIVDGAAEGRGLEQLSGPIEGKIVYQQDRVGYFAIDPDGENREKIESPTVDYDRGIIDFVGTAGPGKVALSVKQRGTLSYFDEDYTLHLSGGIPGDVIQVAEALTTGTLRDESACLGWIGNDLIFSFCDSESRTLGLYKYNVSTGLSPVYPEYTRAETPFLGFESLGSTLIGYPDSKGGIDIGGLFLRTDGTGEGTFAITPEGMHEEAMMSKFGVWNERYYFCRSMYRAPIWSTDGTQEGTMEHSLPYADATLEKSGFVGLDGKIVYHAWVDEKLQLAAWDPETGEFDTLHSVPTGRWILGQSSHRLYFVMTSPDSLPVLWATDGSPDGTVPILSLPGNPPNPKIMDLNSTLDAIVLEDNFNNQLADYKGIWLTDGTSDGTRQLTDFVPQEVHAPGYGSFLLVTMFHDKLGQELYTLDTESGALDFLTDIYEGPMGSYPADFHTSNGITYFSARSFGIGREIHVIDWTNFLQRHPPSGWVSY